MMGTFSASDRARRHLQEGNIVNGKVHLYSAVDAVMTHYEVDVEAATLAKRESIEAPSFVQYAWPHPSRKFLYVTSSNRGPGLKADRNHLSAYRIDSASGALSAHGAPVPLRQRAAHLCVTPDGRFALNAHNVPLPGISVHRIRDDGTPGEEIVQPDRLPMGIYPHQVMVTPSGRTVTGRTTPPPSAAARTST